MSALDILPRVTRQELDEVLGFPRHHLRASLPPLRSCPHAQNYDTHDPRCTGCDHRRACEWLLDNDECGRVGTHSAAEVARALTVAIDAAQLNVIRHYRCTCGTCRWMQRARELLQRLHDVGLVDEAR